jgi:hypothetical protein
VVPSVVDTIILTVCVFVCRICYTSGEFEDLALDEIIQEGHMNILPKEPLTVELKEP